MLNFLNHLTKEQWGKIQYRKNSILMAGFGGYNMIDENLSIPPPFILWGILINNFNINRFLVTKAILYYIVVVIKISHCWIFKLILFSNLDLSLVLHLLYHVPNIVIF